MALSLVSRAKTLLYWLTLTIGRSRIKASHYQSSFGSHSQKWEELFRWFLYALKLEGEILEFGVHLGGTTCAMAEKLAELGSTKILNSFDTFSGFRREEYLASYANGSVTTLSGLNDFRTIYNTAEYVHLKLRSYGLSNYVRITPGDIRETLRPFLKRNPSRRFCFALVDCDLEDPVRFCAETIYDVMIPGGVILFDDYGSLNLGKVGTTYSPGVRKVVHAFVDQHPSMAHGYANGLYHFVK